MRYIFLSAVAIILLLGTLVFGIIALRYKTTAEIKIDWETASEIDTAGFYILRSSEPDGVFVRVNPTIIPASNTPLIGSSYSFTDRNLTAGEEYYYYLEDVEYDGSITRHGPIVVRAESKSGIYALISGSSFLASIYIWLIMRKWCLKSLDGR
jgi:hypothetical protein